MERRCHDLLDTAYSAGIRYIDTARSYGMAEAFLASWFSKRSIPGEAITVGSKWGYTYTGAWRLDAPVHEVKDLSLAALQRQVAESRALLGDRLRLYQIHSATFESGVLEDRGVLAELARLRADGLHIGLTVSGPKQADVIRRALEVEIDGVDLFQSVQATWNLLETSAGSALADAKARGWGVIVKEALANGRLGRQLNVVGQAGRHTGELAAPLTRWADAHGTTADVVALSAALSQPWTDVVLSGAVTSDQLCSGLHALEIAAQEPAWPSMAEPPAEYWARRAKLAWE